MWYELQYYTSVGLSHERVTFVPRVHYILLANTRSWKLPTLVFLRGMVFDFKIPSAIVNDC